MRVLVTGAGGLLGGRLATILAERGFDVVAAYRFTPPPPGLAAFAADLTAGRHLEQLLDALRPEAVVHAAVLGRAAECEQRPDRAEAVNAHLPGRLAHACRSRRLRLVALSTDLVLDGQAALSDEARPARPLGVYGRTKLAGEEAVLAADPTAAVVRIALVVGRGHGRRGTASEGVAWALAAERPVRLFADEYRTPIDPESVASALSRLLAQGGGGRFHLGGPERISRLELGRRAARVLGLRADGIRPTQQSEHHGPDPRPADTSLDSTRARVELGWTPRPLDLALRESRRRADQPPSTRPPEAEL